MGAPKFDEAKENRIIESDISNPQSMAIPVPGSDEVRHMTHVATPSDFSEGSDLGNKAPLIVTGGIALAGAVGYVALNSNENVLSTLDMSILQPTPKVETVEAPASSPAIQTVDFTKVAPATPTPAESRELAVTEAAIDVPEEATMATTQETPAFDAELFSQELSVMDKEQVAVTLKDLRGQYAAFKQNPENFTESDAEILNTKALLVVERMKEQNHETQAQINALNQDTERKQEVIANRKAFLKATESLRE